MKATGIVRRVDDLGRIVIPKESRRTLKIREGVPSYAMLHPLCIGYAFPKVSRFYNFFYFLTLVAVRMETRKVFVNKIAKQNIL